MRDWLVSDNERNQKNKRGCERSGEEVFEERVEVMGIGLTDFLFFIFMLVLAVLWMVRKRHNRDRDHEAAS
jgi:hypothetical protein